MRPLITIRKSMWSITWTFIWTILLSVLIIPVFYLIYKIVEVRRNYTEIYEDRIIEYSGVFNIRKSEHSITKVLGVNKAQSFIGGICGYGDLSVNLVGSHGLSFHNVAKVDEVEKFFKNRIVNANDLRQAIIE